MFLEMKMPLTEALMVSVIGLLTVVVILAVIAVLIIIISKGIRALEASLSKGKKAAPTAVAAPAPAPAGTPMPAGMMQGELELVETDEKTAAIIMAIVSDKSGIPLNRLAFKSIKLMEDNK